MLDRRTLLPPGNFASLRHSEQADARALDERRIAPAYGQLDEALSVWNGHGQNGVFGNGFERQQLPRASRSSGYSLELLQLKIVPFFASTTNCSPVARVAVTSPRPDRE